MIHQTTSLIHFVHTSLQAEEDLRELGGGGGGGGGGGRGIQLHKQGRQRFENNNSWQYAKAGEAIFCPKERTYNNSPALPKCPKWPSCMTRTISSALI